MTAFAFVAVVAVSPRGARACGYGGGGGGYGGIVAAALAVGALDVGLTLWDGGSAAVSHHPSAGYGALEVLIAAPQAALGIAGLRSGYAPGFFVFYTAWMALLTTHGIWTIATAPPATTATIETSPAEIQAPAEPTPQLQLTVGPTYVPVGQLAQPGFGVVGRF